MVGGAAQYCSSACRQAAYRDRRLSGVPAAPRPARVPAVTQPASQTVSVPVLPAVPIPSAPPRPAAPPARRGRRPVPPPETPETGPLYRKIQNTLRESGREDTYLGVLALTLAGQIENSGSLSGAATAARQLELTMKSALEGADTGDELDELRAARDRKLG